MVNAFPVSDGVQGPSCSLRHEEPEAYFDQTTNCGPVDLTGLTARRQLGPRHPPDRRRRLVLVQLGDPRGGGMLIEVFPSDIVV
jgi:hypothetical protein